MKKQSTQTRKIRKRYLQKPCCIYSFFRNGIVYISAYMLTQITFKLTRCKLKLNHTPRKRDRSGNTNAKRNPRNAGVKGFLAKEHKPLYKMCRPPRPSLQLIDYIIRLIEFLGYFLVCCVRVGWLAHSSPCRTPQKHVVGQRHSGDSFH